jgi:hypothetical protein
MRHRSNIDTHLEAAWHRAPALPSRRTGVAAPTLCRLAEHRLRPALPDSATLIDPGTPGEGRTAEICAVKVPLAGSLTRLPLELHKEPGRTVLEARSGIWVAAAVLAGMVATGLQHVCLSARGLCGKPGCVLGLRAGCVPRACYTHAGTLAPASASYASTSRDWWLRNTLTHRGNAQQVCVPATNVAFSE